jgi:hypothetical protein
MDRLEERLLKIYPEDSGYAALGRAAHDRIVELEAELAKREQDYAASARCYECDGPLYGPYCPACAPPGKLMAADGKTAEQFTTELRAKQRAWDAEAVPPIAAQDRSADPMTTAQDRAGEIAESWCSVAQRYGCAAEIRDALKDAYADGHQAGWDRARAEKPSRSSRRRTTKPDDLVDIFIEEVAHVDKVRITSKARRALLNYFYAYGDRAKEEAR